MNTFNILIAGPAGTGLESVSHSLALSFTREGLFVHTNSEYQNRIRGGHNYSQVRVSNQKVTSHSNTFDAVIAMDKQSVANYLPQLSENAFIVFDEKVDVNDIKTDIALIAIPAVQMAEEAGLKLAANVVAVGALFALMDRSIDTFKTVIKSQFERKGDEIVNANYKALELGFNYIQENVQHRNAFTVQGDGKKRFVINGNEAIAMGAIKGGLKYLAAYPMTPGSTIMTTLAKEAKNYDVVVSHVEDEIAAVNMAIGAGYAGVRAGTSTSGGGFALMSEATGLSSMIEAPVIIFNAQRPGPSTGLPTKTGQADLRMAMHCGQGDFPRIVVAAGDHEDCVQLTQETLNFIEEFQIPAIFLTEKYVADSYQTCEMDIAEGIEVRRGKVATDKDLEEFVKDKDGRFPRFADSQDGVSVRSIPGQKGGCYTATSYEHNAYGQPVEEPEEVKIMMEKRWRKIKVLEEKLPDPKVFSSKLKVESLKLTLLVWGSTKGPALEAQQILEAQGVAVEVVQMQYFLPFKTEAVTKILEGKTVIAVEGNQSGQMESVLAEYTGIKPAHSIRNYYGQPISGEWIAEQIRNIK